MVIKYVYLVRYYYEGFEIFSTKEKAKKFILDYAKKEFPKSGLYKKYSSTTRKEYTLKDFIKVSGFGVTRRRVK